MVVMMNKNETDLTLEGMPRRRLKTGMVHGVGFNDATFRTSAMIDGKKVTHRAYSYWSGMLERCYSEFAARRCPTYAGCSVSEEWLTFSNFYLWWKDNYVEGWHLDKDLLSPGNRVYSSETCVYVPRILNNFANDHAAKRGEYPIGVSWHKRDKKLYAVIANGTGRLINLGHFPNELDAHKAWYTKKMEQAHGYKELCDSIHPDLFAGLLKKVESLKAF